MPRPRIEEGEESIVISVRLPLKLLKRIDNEVEWSMKKTNRNKLINEILRNYFVRYKAYDRYLWGMMTKREVRRHVKTMERLL